MTQSAIPASETPLTQAVILKVLAFYIVLTAVMTWPVLVSPTAIKTDLDQDAFIMLWNFWWVKTSLFKLGGSPYVCDWMFYPAGVSLPLHTMTLVYSLMTVPAQAILGTESGLLVGYNLVVSGSFVLSAAAAFALARLFTHSTPASLISGIAFSFCTYRFWHIGRLHLLSTELLVFFFLFFFLAVADGGRKRHALWAALCLALLAYNSLTYFSYAFMFAFLVLGYRILQEKKHFFTASSLGQLALVFAPALLAALPRIGGVAKEVATNPQATPGFTHVPVYSTSMLGFVIPPSDQFVLGRLFSWLDTGYGGTRSIEAFLGFMPILLCLLGVRSSWRKPGYRFWAFVFAVFSVLSLGPFLNVWGKVFPAVPMPYLLFRKFVPFLALSRCPCRYAIVAMLAVSILAGFGALAVAGRWKSESHRRLVFFLLAAAVALEANKIPLEGRVPKVPSVYREIAKLPEDFAVMDIPFTSDKIRRRAMYYQTVHQKRIYAGEVPRAGRQAYAPVLAAAFSRALLKGAYAPGAGAQGRTEVKSSLLRLRYRFVVVHWDAVDAKDHARVRALMAVLDPVAVFEDESVTGYRLY